MNEISNKTLALLVVATLAVVVASVFVRFNGPVGFGPTGFSVSDTGYVNLTINSTLAIQVNTGKKTIDYGQCVPRAGSSYYCATNDSAVCDSTVANNCTGDTTTPQYIEVDNIGNIDANITGVTSSCTAAQLIGGTSPAFQWISTQCNGTGQTTWRDFGSSNVCTNLSYLGGAVRLYTNVTIPYNAIGTCSNNQSTLTFTAVSSP
jgi:hypothetical protein